MSLPNKLTNLDPDQIVRYSFDEDNNASRVVLVGSDFSGVKEAITESLKNMQVSVETKTTPQIETVYKTEYKEIEKPVIVTQKEIEIREIEKPVIVREIEIREIEKPIFVEKVKIEYVEKPVYIEKEKFIELPQTFKVFMAIQTLITMGLLVTLIIK